jgi:hypothetical protein
VRSRRSQHAGASASGAASSAAARFLYLDAKLTAELISGAERGLYGIELESRSRGTDRALGGKVGVGMLGTEIGVQANTSAKTDQHVERELEQNPESRFARLTEILREHGSLKRLESLDDVTVKELRTGDLVELVGTFSVHNLTGLADAVARSRAVTRGLGDDGPTREKVIGRALDRVYNVARQIPGFKVDPELAATVAGAPEFRFSAILDAREMRTGMTEPRQEQHATLLAKLDDVRDTGARMTLLAIFR